MVYVRKLLGGESSSVACGWGDRGGRVEDWSAFNICLSDSQKSTERRTSFERVKQEDRQCSRTDAAVDSANIYMCMFAQHGCV